jgi:Ca-activated chloride channel homolog
MLPSAFLCSAWAQTTDAPAELTFRSEVTEVRVSFSTTDQRNHVVATVQPSDFAIVDQDRVVRDFRSFTRSEYTRLDIAVLVDASGSIAPRFQQELSNVIQLLGPSNGVPEESFAAISFRDLKPTVLCQGNCRALDLGAQFPAVARGGLTPLYDSIVFAARMLGRRDDVHTRKLLILFSDGVDTISLKSLNDAIDSALENDVAIYSVDASAAGRISLGTMVLRGLAANTGGRYFTAESGSDKVLNAILEDLHATYTVAYKLPSSAEGFHLLRILPTHDLGLQFHCRRGYYYPNKF